MRCNSSLGPNSIAWSQANPMALGCDAIRQGYAVSCDSGINELHILMPTESNTYYCSESEFTVAKAALVLLSEYMVIRFIITESSAVFSGLPRHLMY